MTGRAGGEPNVGAMKGYHDVSKLFVEESVTS
jgi:hypothetical protein